MTTSWKQLLTEAESLTKSNGKAAWRTAQILRDLWKNREFLSEACGGVLDDMVSKLAKYSGRFALGVNDMIQMIEHFPNEKDWESGRLDILRDETCKKIAARPKRQGEAARHRTVISQAQYEALQRKLRDLQIALKSKEAEVRRLESLLKEAIGKKVRSHATA